jgi:hypothetical protein
MKLIRVESNLLVNSPVILLYYQKRRQRSVFKVSSQFFLEMKFYHEHRRKIDRSTRQKKQQQHEQSREQMKSKSIYCHQRNLNSLSTEEKTSDINNHITWIPEKTKSRNKTKQEWTGNQWRTNNKEWTKDMVNMSRTKGKVREKETWSTLCLLSSLTLSWQQSWWKSLASSSWTVLWALLTVERLDRYDPITVSLPPLPQSVCHTLSF